MGGTVSSYYQRNITAQREYRRQRREQGKELACRSDESLEQRLWAKVRIGSDSECWEWQGHVTKNGYGQIGHKGVLIYAHRAAATVILDYLDPEATVMHTCDNRRCCNPAHLVVATMAENNADKIAKGRANYRKGEQHERSKLTWEQVREIRTRWLAGGVTLDEMAEEYGVTSGTLMHVTTNRTWVDPAYVPPSRRAKLTATDVREIRRQREAGVKISALADQYGMSERAIRDVASGRRWGSVE
jgi:hypothetical protein